MRQLRSTAQRHRTGTTLAAKNADCEINEAQAVLQLPRRRYPEGAVMRASHIVIPQARETHEIIIDKSYWTWGGEIGVNEHGVAVGNEAIFSTVGDNGDGLITGDLLRLMLERARNCEEAIAVFTDVLERFGQGGNCELRGNSHFDSSYMVSDATSAYVIETAGRHWAVRKVEGVGAISNAMTIGNDWQRCSLANGNGKVDFQATYEDMSKVPGVGSRERQKVGYDFLKSREGQDRSPHHGRPAAAASRWLRSGRRRDLHQHLHAWRPVPDALLAGLRRHDQRGDAGRRHGLGDRHVRHLRLHLQADVFRHSRAGHGAGAAGDLYRRFALVEA